MLTVSRPDVDIEEITDFGVKERFIKLPIKGYLQMLPSPMGNGSAWDQINRPQIALINAVNNPKYRFISAALSRRLGKTFIANVIAQMVELVPGCNVLIMSPNFALSSISFELQRWMIKSFDLEVTRDNLKDKVVELANGSTVRMGSLKTVDSCVGRSYDLIIFDEAALGSDGEEAFNQSLRPTLDRPNSKAIFISTPRGKNNWFSLFYQRGFSKDYPDWCSIHADYTENTRMLESDVLEAKASLSKNTFEQEYMANFNVYEGQIFEIRDKHIEEYVWMEGDEAIGGLDPGYKDPTALVAIIYSSKRNKFYIVDEYLESEATTPEHVDMFRNLIRKWNIETIFIDSAAAQFASDLAYVYDIGTIKAKKDVLPGIAYVQSLIQQDRLLVSPRCDKTLLALDQYQWDARETLTKEKPEHKYSHIPDAIRYALYSFTI